MKNFKLNPQGIDYAGLFSAVNRDKETGIRYGVISCNALHEWFYEALEMDYGDATCPQCGNAVVSACDAAEEGYANTFYIVPAVELGEVQS